MISVTLLRHTKNTASSIIAQFAKLRIVYYVTLVAQFSLVVILVVIIAQIIVFQAYNTISLMIVTVVTYVSAAAVALISATILIGWFKTNKTSYVSILFGLAFLVNVYVYLYLAGTDIVSLTLRDQSITPSSEVVYGTDDYLTQMATMRAFLFEIYAYLSAGVFLMFVAGSAIMLRHYASKMRRLKFWTLLLVPLIYYGSTLVDITGIYIPVTDDDFFAYYTYSSLSGVVGGILLGIAFWVISNALRPSKAVANYLRLCAFGFILSGVGEAASVSVASYPPFGAASISLLTLSTAIIILGLYSTAISISQDIRLRQFIKDLAKNDSGFLSTIGRAQLERQVQTKALDLENVVKEQRLELEKRSGIKSSVEEQDIKQYLLEVLQEVDKHRSSK
jgi:hypothetical protein